MRVKLESKDFSLWIETQHVCAIADVLMQNGMPAIGSATIMFVGGSAIAVPMTKDRVAEAVFGAGGECSGKCGACKAARPGLVS